MPKAKTKLSAADMLKSATTAGTAIQKQDRAIEAQAAQVQSKPSALPLAKILDRATDTRDIQTEHVGELVASIAVLGLLEPLVVDNRGRLLAGAHRRTAIARLKTENSTAYKQHFPDDLIPVRMMDLDADKVPDLALQIEISENEKRRDYTPAEVRSLAGKLKEAGYTEVQGRPAKGEKALRPAIELIIGKSIRTVRRYLNTDSSNGNDTALKISETDRETAALKRLRSELLRWQRTFPEPDSPELSAMDKEIAKLIRRCDRLID
ncbi:MAG: hypothetical protein RLZZ511_2817 [Cyanobacteriota bacterium]|jgi:ParB family chromosome partitioning protein